MRYFILLLLTTVSLTSLDAQSWWNRETVRGNGDVTVENRDVDEFRGVKACCNLEVEVTPGKNHSVQSPIGSKWAKRSVPLHSS